MRESLAQLFPRRSLANRVADIRAEILRHAKVLERLDGSVDLDKLFEMILPDRLGQGDKPRLPFRLSENAPHLRLWCALQQLNLPAVACNQRGIE